MASTSSTAPITHKYDVFLSFRGEDTRYSFTDNLYHALIQAGIRTFRDDDEIRGGQELKPEIERSITGSKASVIVFSENFANSSWCLDELWLILQQRRNAGHFVLPVFIKVDPSDVRNQRGSFTIAVKEGLKWTEDNVKRWKEALTEVADLKGMVLSGSRYEKDFIAEIVDQVRQQLGLDICRPPTSLTGIETRAERVISWLRCDQPDHPVLAICGMGGSGKTTLAKHIYYSNKQNFEGCCLLEEIEKQPDGLLGVQNKLLKDISGSNSMMISDVYEGALQLEKLIQMKRVLIVVDDIEDRDKLSSLFGTNAFHTRSKIIITTRILNIDTWFESVSFRCHVYQLELLNLGESLELLCWHAFGSKVPMDGFEKIAVELAQYCGGNPLALKVLGSSLPVSKKNPSSVDNMKEIWKNRMNALSSLKGDLEHKIRGVLQRSFESLPCHSHKELFLHIACFFVGDYRLLVEKVLEDDYQASYGIMTLINRCLVTVSSNGKLRMHQLLKDMARNIVHEESKDPAKRSRIWDHDEAYRLLSKGDGSDTIEGLRLNLLEGKQDTTSETFKTSSLVKMKNLKILLLNSVKLTGSFENFPDLRWLWWYKSNIKTIPPGLLMSSLVAIHLTFGDLEKFEPPTVLYSLKILDLAGCHKLVSVCNLHRLPKLETLDLSYCTSLTHVCEAIGDLDNLSLLLLRGCTKLWNSSNQKFVNQLEKMKALFICGGIPEQPSFSLPRSLSCLSLCNSLFKILPSHIDLKVLQRLYLNYCSNLKSLPSLPSTLKILDVNWCISLERIAFQTARFTLQEFTYEGCNKLCEIEGLFKLVSVSKLDETDLEPMQWIKAYQNHNVDLTGDVITKDRTFNIQMLYEYGIRSTYLQGIEDQSIMTNYEYMSSSNMLSFRVPMHPKKKRIQGLNVAVLYTSSSGDDIRISPLFTRISNRTQGLTWVYNPVVFCKPRSVETNVVWLSYWPIGNILDVVDEVHLTFLLDKRLPVRECGASIVYMDDGDEVEKEEKSEQMKAGEEVIGGDLSSFQVSKGAYYLCRCNLFKSTPDGLKQLFGNNIESTSAADTKGWRMSRVSGAQPLYPYMTSFQNTGRQKIESEFLVINFVSESETERIEKAVSSVEGVESVIIHNEIGRLFVCGCFNPQAVIKCVTQFEKMAYLIKFVDI